MNDPGNDDGGRKKDPPPVLDIDIKACLSEVRRRSAQRRFMERIADSHIKPIPSLSPDEFHLLDSKRFDEIELMLFDKKTGWVDIHEIRCELYDREVEVYSVHLPNFGLNRLKGNQIGPFMEFVNTVSEILAPEIVVMHCLYGRVDDFISNMEKISEELPIGMRLAIENLPRPGANIRDISSLKSFFYGLKQHRENIGFCLDTTHIPDEEGTDPTEEVTKFIKAVPEWLYHLHLSDKKKDDEAQGKSGDWQYHLPLGHGVIDWKMVKTVLTNEGYYGRAVLEYGRDNKHLLGEGVALWTSLFFDRQPSFPVDRIRMERKDTGSSTQAKNREVEPVSSETCIRILECVTEMDEELVSMLELPPTIFKLGRGESYSFSSSPDRGIGRVFFSLYLGGLWKTDFADYGIALNQRGSHVFCILVDRRRRIIVIDAVNSMYASEGSWDQFKSTLRKALEKAKTMMERNYDFEFIISREGFTKIT